MSIPSLSKGPIIPNVKPVVPNVYQEHLSSITLADLIDDYSEYYLNNYCI